MVPGHVITEGWCSRTRGAGVVFCIQNHLFQHCQKGGKRSDNIIYLYIASFSSLNKGNNLIFLNKSTKNNLKIIKHEFHQLPLSDNIMLEHSLSPLWLENISHKSWLFSKHHLNFLPPASNEIKTCKSHGYKNSIKEK